MTTHSIHVNFVVNRSLQEQLRDKLIAAILAEIFLPDKPLPSCRKLASQLAISRNTIALVYESLLNDGYLVSRPRSGYYLYQNYLLNNPEFIRA